MKSIIILSFCMIIVNSQTCKYKKINFCIGFKVAFLRNLIFYEFYYLPFVTIIKIFFFSFILKSRL